MFIVYVIGWLACAVTIYAVARTTVEQSWTRSDAISLLSLVIPWWPLVLLWLLLAVVGSRWSIGQRVSDWLDKPTRW